MTGTLNLKEDLGESSLVDPQRPKEMGFMWRKGSFCLSIDVLGREELTNFSSISLTIGTVHQIL